jgi:RimJ/RimL family protein N-acetyltransferase
MVAENDRAGGLTESFQMQTERLKLRRLNIGDAELMLAVWNDPAFIRYVGDRGIRNIDDARQTLMDVALRMYAEYGYGPYRVALKSDDSPIGTCGLFRREGLDDVDIGFAILPEFCGRGYAYEAAQAVVLHARNDIGLARVTALVSTDNAVSIGLIEKLGLTFERMVRLPGEEDDVRLYAMRL